MHQPVASIEVVMSQPQGYALAGVIGLQALLTVDTIQIHLRYTCIQKTTQFKLLT